MQCSLRCKPFGPPGRGLHPVGENDLVKPISNLADVDRVRRIIKDNPQHLLLFDLATQTGCKLKKALQLKVGDLWLCQVGDPISDDAMGIEDDNKLIMTRLLYETYQRYLKLLNPGKTEFLFKSRKGGGPLTPTSVSRLIRTWFEKAGLEGLSGYSSLNKTGELFFASGSSVPGAQNSPMQPSTLTPVSSKTRQETVYEKLQKAISQGDIRPGTRLKNEQISKQLGVSDTPVREALARLRAEGLVTRADHKGYEVKQLTPEDLDEIVRIRVKLECMAAREACKHIKDEDIKRLAELQVPNERIKKDIKEFFRFNQLFHKSIYEAANMPTLLNIIENLWDKMSPYFNLLAPEILKDDPSITWDRHKHIIEGLRRRDPEHLCEYLNADITEFASQIILKMVFKKSEFQE